MHLFHAVAYFVRESRRMRALENSELRRRGKATGSEWYYWTRFFPSLVKFLRLEWKLQHRALGYTPPVRTWNTNPRKGGRHAAKKKKR